MIRDFLRGRLAARDLDALRLQHFFGLEAQ